MLAYADGFWMVALRGAVGAIERTQEPFTSWWRESTLAAARSSLFAVLGALTLAKRWFGPVLRTTRPVVLTGLLIAAAGTLVGVVQLAISSVYDYQAAVRRAGRDGLDARQLQRHVPRSAPAGADPRRSSRPG